MLKQTLLLFLLTVSTLFSPFVAITKPSRADFCKKIKEDCLIFPICYEDITTNSVFKKVLRRCKIKKPKLLLFDGFYNEKAWGTGAVSCHASICWGWSFEDGNIRFYSVSLPFKISLDRAAIKKVEDTIEKSDAFEKSSKQSAVLTLVHFFTSHFETNKKAHIQQKQGVSTGKEFKTAETVDITPDVLNWIQRGLSTCSDLSIFLQKQYIAAASVSLLQKISFSRGLPTLVEWFLIYKNVNPDTLNVSNLNNPDVLVKASAVYNYLLYLFPNLSKKDAWAGATLYMSLYVLNYVHSDFLNHALHYIKTRKGVK